MKRYTAPILFIGLSILFVILLMPYTEDPEIYAIAHVEEAGVFKNPIALKQISQEKTGDLQPLMQDFFDTSGTIVLNVRLKNFEDAEKDLAEYRRAASQFDRMVINLDMSESEIGDFKKNNAENIRNLEELLNDSVAFDELSRLEIQYQDTDDPTKMYAIAYEGEALREKITQEFGQYQKNTAAMAPTGKKIDVHPEPIESSVDIFEEYLREIGGTQEERVVRASDTVIPFREDLSLIIDPFHGIYGDEIHATGVYARAGTIPTGEPVTLYIDSKKYAGSSCSNTGEYDIGFTILQQYPGIHLAYTRAGDAFSPIIPFTVTGTDGVLTLNISVRGSTVFSSGMLRTEDRDVTNAPVNIYFRSAESENMTTVYTDKTGAYSCKTELTSGDYTIQSVFSEPSFPVHECRSEESTISIGQSNLYIFIVLFIICAGGAGYLIFNRRQRIRAQKSLFNETSEPDKPEDLLPVDASTERSEGERKTSLSHDNALQHFRTMYIAQKAVLSPADSARILGEGFTAAVGYSTARECRPSETMREHMAKLDERCRKEASVFVTIYEASVYGRRDHTGGDELLSAWDKAIQCMGEA